MASLEWTPDTVLNLLQAPERLIKDEVWRNWINAHGGLDAVYARLQQFPLKEKPRAVLNVLLGNPGMSIEYYAETLFIHFTTFHNHRRALVRTLVQFLNNLDAPVSAPPVGATLPPAPNMGDKIAEPITPLVGRGHVLEALIRSMHQTRILSLVGTGGVGKTRLALELGRWLMVHDQRHVSLVELSGLNDPDLIINSIAAPFGIGENFQQTILDSLCALIGDKQWFLILDNCEHLIAGCARIVAVLARRCAHLRIITTSREPLGIIGEHVYWVDPLSVPPLDPCPPVHALEQYDAVRLFLMRAKAIHPLLTITDDNALSIVRICHALDGLPLALELAAVQLRHLSLPVLLERLSQRFQLLAKGNRAAFPRQQTLQSLVDWSYDLLTESERQAFLSLAVFAGGWSLEAAEAICGRPDPNQLFVNVLGALVDKSLVVVDSDHQSIRYRMLETLRQYAEIKLDASPEGPSVRAAHAGYFVAFAEALHPRFQSRTQNQTYQAVSVEHDNIRKALAWSLRQGAYENIGRLAAALGWYWDLTNSMSEGIYWLSIALDHPDRLSRAVYKQVLHATGVLVAKQNDNAGAQHMFEQYLDICRSDNDYDGIAEAYNELGTIYGAVGDLAGAHRLFVQVCELWQAVGNHWALAIALMNRAYMEIFLGQYEAARD
ncbi:MAG TPA: AAA family ATPase, partial [Herpetosiphonaceae bacterium]|nr:AAA family ATPase [Herpetosiphonaceae bacterium]